MVTIYNSESISNVPIFKAAVAAVLHHVYIFPLHILDAIGTFGQSAEGHYNRYARISIVGSIAVHAFIIFMILSSWNRFKKKAEPRPNQSLQPTPGMRSSSILKSPARRG